MKRVAMHAINKLMFGNETLVTGQKLENSTQNQTKLSIPIRQICVNPITAQVATKLFQIRKCPKVQRQATSSLKHRLSTVVTCRKDLPAQHQEDQHDSSDRFKIRNFCESSETTEEKQELARQREENKVGYNKSLNRENLQVLLNHFL